MKSMYVRQNKKNISLNILDIAGIKPYKKQINEKYMNKLQINHFKKILYALYKQLIIKTQNKHFIKNKENTNFPDPIDRAVQEEEFTFNLINKDRERKLINKIKNTIKKIKENNFGYCDICGTEIGIKRLEAQPTAKLCIDCKVLSEIKKKKI